MSYPRGVAPRTPPHALSRAAAPARSGRVARSRARSHCGSVGEIPSVSSLPSLAGFVDLIEGAAVGEMRLLGGLPSAERLVDREQAHGRERRGVLRRHVGGTRPIEILRDDL